MIYGTAPWSNPQRPRIPAGAPATHYFSVSDQSESRSRQQHCWGYRIANRNGVLPADLFHAYWALPLAIAFTGQRLVAFDGALATEPDEDPDARAAGSRSRLRFVLATAWQTGDIDAVDPDLSGVAKLLGAHEGPTRTTVKTQLSDPAHRRNIPPGDIDRYGVVWPAWIIDSVRF